MTAMRGEAPAPREQVFWPGSADAVRNKLEALSGDWEAALCVLSDADLERPLAYPWPDARPLGRALAWANLELMKNVAEIGCVRHLYEASRRAP
jgi:hypothetical protein